MVEIDFIKFDNYYFLRQMSQIQGLLRLKGDTIDRQQFCNLMRMEFCDLDDSDLDAIISTYIPTNPILNKYQYMHIFYSIKAALNRFLPRDSSNAHFALNSFVRVENNRIFTEPLSNAQIDPNSDFKDILGEQFYRKLINYGSNGLLFQKFQQKPQKSYSMFQWIQQNVEITINDDQSLYLQLLKKVWLFKFDQALQTLQKIKITHAKDNEIPDMQIGLAMFRQAYQVIINNEQLKQVFIDRKEFTIKYQQNQHNNKHQLKQFNRSITQVKQKLIFNANYFSFIRKDIKNRFYYAIACFLSNRYDNYIKFNDQIISIEEISITDRFTYARRFYRSEDFQAFKSNLMERCAQFNKLDYVLLFGTKAMSEVILQNYMDETNQIQKAAMVSVYLKLFLEQSKVTPKDNRGIFCNKFIKSYELLIMNMDMGILKHKFDQKCTTIEVQRKKKTMNKTFSFNCTNCKNGQSLLSITKRIGIDMKQHQLKMKGNNYFSKDNRNQVNHCIDCMNMLPRCAICLFPHSVYNGYAQQMKKNSLVGQNKVKNGGQNLANSIVWCPKCFHGGHFAHIMRWMQRAEKKCPVYSCKCKCSL